MAGDLDIVLSELDVSQPEKIVSTIDSWVDRDVNRKQERCMNWSEAINFLTGNQWIRYNQRDYRWEAIPVTDANRVIDRPVTNHILRWVTINLASFTNRPLMIVDPNSEQPVDKQAAKIADIVLSYLWESHDKDDQYYEAALWGIVCGTVFRKSSKILWDRYYDGTAGKVPIKKVCPEVVSPFCISFDGLPSRWADVGVVMQTAVKRKDQIRRMYGCNEEGYFPENLEKLKEENIQTNPLALNEGLKSIVDGGSFFASTISNAGSVDYTDCCLLKEVYVRPSVKYPRGLAVHVAGGQLLYFGPSSYYYMDGKVWHPYTSWSVFKTPGSIWGIGLVQQLIKLQRRINTIDALLCYNRKTMAIGRIFAPSGCNLPEGSLVGQPGQVTTYDETQHGGKPEFVPGVALPAQIVEERMMILADGEKLSLGGDIRSGDNPKGVTTLGQLQILNEQNELARSKQVESWEKFIERSEQLDLLNFQDTYQLPIKEVYESFRKYSKDITLSDWKNFKGNDLRDNASIRIEKGSTVARSRLLRQDTIIKLLPTGVLGDFLSDPYQHKKFLEEFGLVNLYTDVNIDQKYAEKAIEMMLEGVQPPLLEGVHNPDVILPIILRYMKDPKFMEVSDTVKIIFDNFRQLLVTELAKNPLVPNQPLVPEQAPKMTAGQGRF